MASVGNASLGASFIHAGLGVWIANPYPQGENETDTYRMGRLLDPKRSARPVFVPAKVVEVCNDGKVSVRTEWEPKLDVVCPKEELYLANVCQDVDDMTNLAHLNDATLLDNVQTRYHREPCQQIYTMAGPILIAVNPYRIVTDKHDVSIYDKSYMDLYRSAPVSPSGCPNSALPPHIFAVASRAVATFADARENQSIVISGESGAGKTESTKQIMQFVTSCSGPNGSSAEEEEGIESKLLQTNPVLEAIGNAKTVRNDNSSRFGKFIQIFMEPKSGPSAVRILGGSIQDFLLEKSRVVTHSNGERNYHVFYQLLAGLSPDAKAQLGLELGENAFRYLNPEKQRLHAESMATKALRGRTGSRNRRRTQSQETSAAAAAESSAETREIDDLSAFQELEASLKIVGLGDERREHIFQIIAGILHLGNIELETSGAGSEEARVCGGPSNEALQKAASLFGVECDALADAIVTKETSTGAHVISSQLDKKRAYDGLDALAKSTYGLLFRWVVSEINRTLSNKVSPGSSASGAASPSASASYIGILDIFGFEVFRQNGFEQFCINFANEKLHQLFTTHVFKLEQRVYEEEGIDYSAITFTDNQLIIDLVEKRPRGIMSLLDEACLFPQSTDESFLSKLDQAHADVSAASSAFYRKASLRETEAGPAFVVMHSAATVVYTVSEFLDKNRDRLESKVVRVMAASSSSVVSALFREQQAASEADQGSFTGSNAFLGSKFKDDINRLMRTLNATTPHFVRCLKANGEKRPGYMDPQLVLHQLLYLGVLDSIRIRHSGFSFRTSFASFYSRFALVEPSLPSPASLRERVKGNESDPLYRSKCKELVALLWATMAKASNDSKHASEGEKSADSKSNGDNGNAFIAQGLDSMVQLGQTRIFLRKQAIQTLEALREVKLRTMDAAATRIQSLARMHRVRAKIDSIRRGLERIRAAWAAVQDRRAWVHHMKVQETVRRTALVWKARTLLAHRRKALIKIQAFVRGLRPRRVFLVARRCAIKAQRVVRSFILRKRFRMWTHVVTRIQSMVRSFLVRNRLYWRRANAALTIQAGWRGTQERRSMPRMMAFLAERRRLRARRAACKALQRRWRSFLVRRRFLEMRAATRILQRWSMGFVLCAQFKAIRASVRTLQRVGRGFLARNLRRRLVTARLLEDEVLEVNRLRYREAAAIEAANTHPCSAQKANFQRRGANQAAPICKNNTLHHAVLDIDVRANIANVYPTAWTDLCRRVDASSVDAGEFHSLALTADGEVYTWGYGDRGQLGHGVFGARKAPGRLPELMRMRVPCIQVAAGSFHCMVLTRNCQVLTWGAGSHGQLGHGDRDNDACPRIVKGLANRKIVQIASGATHCVALAQAGTVFTWGGPGAVLGHGAFVGEGSLAVPEPVRSLARERVDQVASGRDFVLARARSGKLFAWGAGAHGQLGLGDTRDRVFPRELALPGERDCALVTAGGRHAAAVDVLGRLFMWGCNSHGQLGLGDATDRHRPTCVNSLPGPVEKVALGWRQTVVTCRPIESGHGTDAAPGKESLFAWGATSLPLGMADRARGTLLDSCVDETSIFRCATQVMVNLDTCGRRVKNLTCSKAPSLSFVGLVYEQKPATLAVHTSPLLANTDIAPLFSRRSDKIHRSCAANEESDEAPTILVDEAGTRHDMASMSHGALQSLVRDLIASGPSAKAFLTVDPDAAGKKRERLRHERKQETVHGVRYAAANSVSATRIKAKTSSVELQMQAKPQSKEVRQARHSKNMREGYTEMVDVFASVGDEEDKTKMMALETRANSHAESPPKTQRTRASSVTVRRQRELEANIDVDALRAQARARDSDMAGHFAAKALLLRRKETEEKSQEEKRGTKKSSSQSTMESVKARLEGDGQSFFRSRLRETSLGVYTYEELDEETKSDGGSENASRDRLRKKQSKEPSSQTKRKDEVDLLLRKLQARAQRDVSAMWTNT
ncbi:Myosin-9 [Hondaea fermentalgiana]|uniref:Myosin-9 n=1 Tax=Hondaea fermentalgiana TaxID=2315210 RepID=A0A2R5GAA7_9STRA|nr:Myosin-9 [Hondaea fermentalgiana]|eukprot:GBG27525.1 Myosin-9 [Hondaea fermentalgiana]